MCVGGVGGRLRVRQVLSGGGSHGGLKGGVGVAHLKALLDVPRVLKREVFHIDHFDRRVQACEDDRHLALEGALAAQLGRDTLVVEREVLELEELDEAAFHLEDDVDVVGDPIDLLCDHLCMQRKRVCVRERIGERGEDSARTVPLRPAMRSKGWVPKGWVYLRLGTRVVPLQICGVPARALERRSVILILKTDHKLLLHLSLERLQLDVELQPHTQRESLVNLIDCLDLCANWRPEGVSSRLAGLLVERVRAAHRLTAELDAQQLELERLNILARHLLEASDQWYTPSAMMTIDNNGGQ